MDYKIIKQRKRNKRNLIFSEELKKQFGLSLLCSDYLISKGINDIDSAERFLRPKESHLYSPMSFSDITAATERISAALINNEQICIYGDYDCDGICASVIIYKYLKTKNANVDVYLPDRFSDGYGLNINAVNQIHEKGCTLIITVDNGITAYNEIEYASSLGIDVILTDHHEPPLKIPKAFAVIDPKNQEELYPFDDICGSTVAFKMALAMGIDDDMLKHELLCFAAIATVADLVPLIDENRTIVSLGLKYLKEGLNLGLNRLIKVSGLEQTQDIAASDIAFKIAPRINACGRLLSAKISFELFTTQDDNRAGSLAEQLNEINEERKAIEESLIESAEKYLSDNKLLAKQKVLFIPLKNAHEGVIGIAAGKICEEYNRPVIVGSVKEGMITASCRSIPGFNIYTALCAAGDLFVKFGGHSQAAGFTIKAENFNELISLVNQQAEYMNVDNLLIKHSYYDVEAVPAYVTKTSVSQMEAFAPYGLKNPKPVFKFDNVSIRSIAYMGASGNHVRCTITTPAATFSAVGFSMAAMFRDVDPSLKYDVLFTPSINAFRGANYLQLEIKDFQTHINVPDEYYQSLYNHFYVNNNSSLDFRPEKNQFLSLNMEGAVDKYSDALFVVYGKDMLVRMLRYCTYKHIELSISFGNDFLIKKDCVNLIVNPCSALLPDYSGSVIVLDSPCFCGYEARYYEGKTNVLFLKSEAYLPSVFIDREYIAFIYKKLPALKGLENSLSKYIDYLNSQSVLQVNYFLLRICLDILNELGIIDYEIQTDKLFIEFEPISGLKDINMSSVMQKLAKAYA